MEDRIPEWLRQRRSRRCECLYPELYHQCGWVYRCAKCGGVDFIPPEDCGVTPGPRGVDIDMMGEIAVLALVMLIVLWFLIV